MARSSTQIVNQVITGTGADTSSRPSVAFGDADTGFYETTDDKLAIVLGGTETFFYSGSEFTRADGTVIGGAVADDSIKSQHILDGAIVNEDISGLAQITLNKLADGTQGQVLFYNSANEISGLAVGTSGQVLTTQGAGANPIYTTVSNPNFQRRGQGSFSISPSVSGSTTFLDVGSVAIAANDLTDANTIFFEAKSTNNESSGGVIMRVSYVSNSVSNSLGIIGSTNLEKEMRGHFRQGSARNTSLAAGYWKDGTDALTEVGIQSATHTGAGTVFTEAATVLIEALHSGRSQGQSGSWQIFW